jgi:hypothetical protein
MAFKMAMKRAWTVEDPTVPLVLSLRAVMAFRTGTRLEWIVAAVVRLALRPATMESKTETRKEWIAVVRAVLRAALEGHARLLQGRQRIRFGGNEPI